MVKGILVVESSPESADRDDDYNEWYDGTHIPQLLEVPGIRSARRYRLTGAGGELPTYLAIYELEADDLDAPMAEMGARARDGRLSPPVALKLDPPPVPKVFELLE